MDTATNTDCIRKQALLHAPISRVWRAISNAQEFGNWFRVALEGELVEGAHVRGRITYPGYEHLTAELFIERVRPQSYFSFRWHPNAVDPKLDYSNEPTTLVEFELAEMPSGTQLTITESGFDRLPAGRRADAFRGNDEGWTAQLENVSKHVASG
jgi:uncharacterized protein YndB with AHSA1/START domain